MFVKKRIKTSLVAFILLYSSSFANDIEKSNNLKDEISIGVSAQTSSDIVDKDPKKFIAETKGINRVKGKNTGQIATVTTPVKKKVEKIFGQGSEQEVAEYTKVSLLDVVLETVSNNFNVKVAREKVRQAQINLDDAYSGYKPTIDLEYKYGSTTKDPSDDGEETEHHSFHDESVKLSLTQNLYAGGATMYKIKGLEKTLLVAQNRYNLAISKEIQNATKAYLGVVFSHQSLNVTELNMKMLQRILEIVTIKYDLGAASIGDISSIKASVANAQSKLSKTNSKFVESLKYYEYIAGEKFKYTIPYEYNLKIILDDLEKLIEKAYDSNLNIQSYRLTVESESYKLKSARSAFEPKVDLELSLTRTHDKDAEKEDFYHQNSQVATVTFSYNLYNQGKDTNKILSVYSTVREVKYKIEEEKRKLKWIVSNLHQSLSALESSIQSTINEVESSQVTVESYWEAFQNGEQDLQTLLAAQKQLNSAQVSLIESYQSRLNDYFTLKFETGQLVSYFSLDPTKDNYIDFTNSSYQNQNIALKDEQMDLIEFAKQDRKKEDNTKEVIKKVDTLEDILLFKDKFLDSDDNLFTIQIGKFDSIYDTFNFIKNNNFSEQAFIVDELEDYKFKSILAYGIFEDEQEAYKVLDTLKASVEIDSKIVSIKDIKDLYKAYIAGYDELRPKELVETTVIKMVPKPPQEYFTNKNFKNDFLNANEDYYTINLATLSKLDNVVRFINKEDIYDNSFIFRYGTNSEWIKIVYGVYKNYSDAEIALASLPSSIKDKYYPVIENIKAKQDLFNKYSSLRLGTPSFSTNKNEFIKISEETKVQLRDAQTKSLITQDIKTPKKIEKIEEVEEVKEIKEVKDELETLVKPKVEEIEVKTVEKSLEELNEKLKIEEVEEIKEVEKVKKVEQIQEIEEIDFSKDSIALENEEKIQEKIEEQVQEKKSNIVEYTSPKIIEEPIEIQNEKVEIEESIKIEEVQEKEEVQIVVEPKIEEAEVKEPEIKIEEVEESIQIEEKIEEVQEKEIEIESQIQKEDLIEETPVVIEPKIEEPKVKIEEEAIEIKNEKIEIEKVEEVEEVEEAIEIEEKIEEQIEEVQEKEIEIESQIQKEDLIEETPIVIEPKIEESEIKEPEVKSEEEKLDNTNLNEFKIVISKVKKDRLQWFISRFQLVEYKTRELLNNEVEIYIDNFSTKDDAQKSLGTYHPKIQSLSKIIEIEKE